MGQILTLAIAVALISYAAYVVWKNINRVKKGQCPGGCGTCTKNCGYREENSKGGGEGDDNL